MRSFITLLALATSALAASSSSSANGSSKTASGSGTTVGTSAAPTGTGSALPSLPSGITPCAFGCITAAASPNVSSCTSFADAQCVCTDINYQTAVATCLQAECQASEAPAAVAAQNAICDPLSLSATGSATATAPFVPVNSAADISSSGAPSGASSPSGSSPSTPSGNTTSGGNTTTSSGSTTGSGVAISSPGLGLTGAVAVVGALVGAAVLL